MEHFTENEIAALREYVKQVQGMMGLSDWKIKVMNKAPDDDSSYAQADTNRMGKDCFLRFDPEYFHMNHKHQRETVVHELLHVWWQHPISDYEKFLSPDVTMLMNRQVERIVDGMAIALAELFPLPQWSNHTTKDE